jgi:hypothetical protein
MPLLKETKGGGGFLEVSAGGGSFWANSEKPDKIISAENTHILLKDGTLFISSLLVKEKQENVSCFCSNQHFF